MKISIIIPCYNIESHLSKCIDSVLCQTHTDFELLLIDDGSSDKTFAICEKYQKIDTRIKVFHHENRGVSYSRNRGIELAQGNYVMFIDGDDYVQQDLLEQFVTNFQDNCWSMCGMFLVENAIPIERDLYRVMLNNVSEKILTSDAFFKVITYHNLSTPCCRLYDKIILRDKNIRFNEMVSFQEDFIFNLEYLNHISKIQLLDYYGYYYVNHEISSSLQYHKNFVHIELLFGLLDSLAETKEECSVVQRIIFDTIIKKIANEYHPKSITSLAEKRAQLKIIFESKYFEFIYEYIPKSAINPIFKLLLRWRNSHLLSFFLNLKFATK